MEGTQKGTFTHQGHRLLACLMGPCEVSMRSPTEGWRGGRGLPAPALLGMGSDSSALPMGFPAWYLRLSATDGDVVSVWGHPSGVALELSCNNLMVNPNLALPHLCPS